MRQNLSYNDHVLYSNLIEYIQTVLVVFMNDEPDMSARELKIQSFLFFLLVIWLRVVVGHHMAKFAVVRSCSQFDKDLD